MRKKIEILLVLGIAMTIINSCKKSSDDASIVPNKQFEELYEDYFDKNNNFMGRVIEPRDSEGSFYYFKELEFQYAIDGYSTIPPFLFCYSSQSYDSTYFIGFKSSPQWSFKNGNDTIKGIIYNPGDTTYFPNVKKIVLTLAKSHYAPADTCHCE